MTLTTLNPAQMMVIESFAGVTSEDELKGLMKVLKRFYAEKLEQELQRLWDNGTLNEAALEELGTQHLRTPYRSL